MWRGAETQRYAEIEEREAETQIYRDGRERDGGRKERREAGREGETEEGRERGVISLQLLFKVQEVNRTTPWGRTPLTVSPWPLRKLYRGHVAQLTGDLYTVPSRASEVHPATRPLARCFLYRTALDSAEPESTELREQETEPITLPAA